MANLVPITRTSKEIILEKILYINYLFNFWKNVDKTQTLTNFGYEVNIIILEYISKLSLKVYYTNIRA